MLVSLIPIGFGTPAVIDISFTGTIKAAWIVIQNPLILYPDKHSDWLV